MKKTIGEMSVDSRAIYQRLMAAKIGDLVTYKELATMTGRDLQHGDRYVLMSACRAAQRDGAVFGVVRGEGVKRLADAEIVSSAAGVLPRIRRASKRAIRRLTAVSDFAALPNDAKIAHNTYASIFGAIAAVSTHGAVQKVEAKVKDAAQTLPLAKTLEAFK